MKINRGVGVVLIAICLLVEPASNTILTTTLFTGFVGGFLVGKVTLGTFLTIMNSLNQGKTPVAAGTSSGTAAASQQTPAGTVAVPRGSEEDQRFQGISASLENQVRDRFLRELGKMDPLNCLPKVFCEISADPTTANGIFGDLGFVPPTKAPIKKGLRQKKKKVSIKDEAEDDLEDEDSESESEEDEMDEETQKLHKYQEKENAALESKALEELIDEFDDPISYYFILKDKKKNIHPELKEIMSGADMSKRMDGRSRLPGGKKVMRKTPKVNPGSLLIRRIGQAAKSSVESSFRTISKKEKTIDDAFESDPFFDDFAKSLNEPTKPKNSIRYGQVELLRRSRRDVDTDAEHDGTMAKYRMAAKIAETFKDPSKCRKVFSTCPYSSEEVMSLITKMNEQEESTPKTVKYSVKRNKKPMDDGLKNLKNTLQVIEKLNYATTHAQIRGEPVDYEQIIRDAEESEGMSETSDKIIEDLEQFEDNMEASETQGEVTLKPKKSKKKSLKKKVVTRHRRHGVEDSSVPVERLRTSRLSLVSPQGPQKMSRLAYSSSEDDGDTEEDPRPFSTSVESKLQTRLQLKPPPRRPVRPKPMTFTSSQETKGPLKSEEEDDEIASPEYEETRVRLPTFSQTFLETVQNPPKNKNKPRPVHPVVKVKEQYAKAPTTSRPSTTSTTPLSFRVRPEGPNKTNSGSRYSPRPARPAASPQKFSGEVEDDEVEAIEKPVEAPGHSPPGKYKPKRPSLKSSLISS